MSHKKHVFKVLAGNEEEARRQMEAWFVEAEIGRIRWRGPTHIEKVEIVNGYAYVTLSEEECEP